MIVPVWAPEEVDEMVSESAKTISGGLDLRSTKQLVAHNFRSNFQRVTTLIG